jgi:hypothetical protein
MIQPRKFKFIVFLNEEREIVGSTCFVIDLKEKKGYLRSLVVRKEWLGILDASKAYITACLLIFKKYRDRILIWWGEARTADAKSQFINRQCSVRPIAWLPNKDIFYNKIESDLMMIAYDKRIFEKYRSKQIPVVIPSVVNCFLFADMQYELGRYKTEEPSIAIDLGKISRLKKLITIEEECDKHGYTTIRFGFKKSDSYFTFLYTPRVKNFEKTEYKVILLEELYVFLEEFKNFTIKLDVRYIESRVSAYNPDHQKIFEEFGFKPRGYIPAFKWDKELKKFEDYIIFNKFQSSYITHYELIEEGYLLIEFLSN